MTLSTRQDPLALGVVSTYPPREDGIATFTRDLLDAVCSDESAITPQVAAITDPDAYYAYPRQVRWEIDQADPESYAEIGRALSRSGAAAVSLQHEFGLYGVWGAPIVDYTPGLLDTLTVPLVTTLHTVLPQPSPDIRDSIRRICDRSAATVVMARVGAKILIEDYEVDPERLVNIPHGVPAVRPIDRTEAKQALRLANHTIICTFGLLGRGKAIENVIRALPDVLARYPDTIYLIVGATHPQVRRREGESYREELIALARGLGVSRQVRFVNQYLNQDGIVQYLQASDIYITPYRDRNQITSGTLSYALGCGCAIISTPYVYAAEALSEGRGLLADFDNPESFARCMLIYLDDPSFRKAAEERALTYGLEMAWPRVGQRYADLFRQVAQG